MGNSKHNLESDQNSERRSGQDRREYSVDLEFPFIDSHGNLVTAERRHSERRNSQNINSQQADLKEQKSYA